MQLSLIVFSTSDIRLRCNKSDHRLSLGINALKVAKETRGAYLCTPHLTVTQIHDRKGVFFAVLDNMSNLTDQTNPSESCVKQRRSMKHTADAILHIAAMSHVIVMLVAE